MLTPTRILVPTDFSACAEHALDYAVGLAARLDAKLDVLHVAEIPVFGVPELAVAMSSSVIEQVLHDSQDRLDQLLAPRRDKAKLGPGLLRTGDARDVIVHTAQEIGADLIVMGTHGRRGLSRALLGSVAESVVRMAPIPVLTLRTNKKRT